MTLMPGDVIVTGTPSGVGHARKPPLWMKHGDVCEIESRASASCPIRSRTKRRTDAPAGLRACGHSDRGGAAGVPRRRAQESSASARPGEIAIGVGHGIGFLPLYLAQRSQAVRQTCQGRRPERRASWSSAYNSAAPLRQALAKGETRRRRLSASRPFCWRARQRQSRWSRSPESPPCRWCCSPRSRTSSRCPT